MRNEIQAADSQMNGSRNFTPKAFSGTEKRASQNNIAGFPRITINTLSECDACTLVCSHENCVCFRDLIEFANANENVAQEIALRYCNCKFVQNPQDNLPSFSAHSAAGFRPCIRRVKTLLSSPGQSCSACSSSLLSSFIHFRRRLLSGFILLCEILSPCSFF